MIHTFLQDLGYALRIFRKNIGSTLVIVLSLAIGIGANSAIFSVIDALLLHQLPYPSPDRLAAIWLHSPGTGILRDWPSPGQFIDIRNQNHSFEQMALAQSANFTLTGQEQPERISGMVSQSNLLAMLGAHAQLGRLLLPQDDQPGKPTIVILTDHLWRRLFNSDPTVIGRAITLDGEPYTVVGVLSSEFLLNNEVMPSEGAMDKVDVILPLPLGPDAGQKRRDENYNIMVRLRPDVTLQQAQLNLDVIAGQIRKKENRDQTFGMHIIGLQEQVVGNVRRTLLVLQGSVALVLLIACANVANLLLSRASRRVKEIAVRTALGAKWQRLVGQLLTESVLLSLMGGAAGLVLASLSLQVVRAIRPGNIPRLEEVSISGTVLAFTFGISLFTGILFGLAPAWRAIKVDLNATLKAGRRDGQSSTGLRISRHQLSGLLVVSELALSLILLIGAGLLTRSFVRLQRVAPGFTTDHILSMQVAVNGSTYQKGGGVAGFYREIEDRIAHLPGVLAEGAISTLPLGGEPGWGEINVEGYTPPPGEELLADIRFASPDYFRTMEIPLIEGGFFDDQNTITPPRTAVIDEKFAHRFWPQENPIGKHLWFNPKKPFTIVGVVAAVKQEGLDSNGKIALYLPHLLFPTSSMFLVARTSSEAAGLANSMVREIYKVDPTAAVYNVNTMQDLLQHSLARPRFSTALLGSLATFALILAAVGVFSVLSYLVSQNTLNIGVRVALGAPPSRIIGLVVSQGMMLAGIGIVTGVLGAVVLTRLMTNLLFEVRATDALTFGSVIAILAATALAATVIPALRAIRVDPMMALRE